MSGARPRVLITRRWPEAAERRMIERFDVTLNEGDRPLDEAALIDAMQTFDAVCPTVSDRVGAAVIGAAGRRTAILGNFGVGYDHIDIVACRNMGIAVTNTPGVLTDATADLTLTLMLMAARRGGEGERLVRAGGWTGWGPTQLLGQSPAGRTLGLVGCGRIARAVAQRAHHGFGMRILYFARGEAGGADVAALGAEWVPDLHTLLGRSDIVSLHVPGGAETRHLINAAALEAMKPEALLINTARGDVLDHAALVDALKAGRIAGAGLDVYPLEPDVPAGLVELENVVLLPHLGSATVDTRVAMGLKVFDNLDAWFAGKAPPDRVV
jgi:lactate dehydrogenase-like 2-hydroxyacid dehydrogenase